MSTVYLGTSPFAASVLVRLAGSPHRPALVITRPDRPRGRGRRVAAPPVAEVARELDLELYQPDDVNSEPARERIATVAPRALAVCAFGALIREPLLSEHPLLNVHPSLLPRWRGAAPIERAIDAGDERTGVSIIRLVAALDAGPIGLQSGEPIAPYDDFGSLSGRLAATGADLLVAALEREPKWVEQPDRGVTYAEKIEAADRRLDPAREAGALERRVRALSPHIGAYVELAGAERLIVRRARALSSPASGRADAVVNGAAPVLAASPGELVVHADRLMLACDGGALELLEVQPAGGRVMEAAAYVRGRRSPRSSPRSRA